MTLAGLAARNVLRNKFRTVLTVLGVAVALMAFVLLRTVISSWEAAAQYSAKDRIATRHKVSFVVQLPKHYIDTIRQIRGVKAATWMNWFGGKDPNAPDDFFATMAVDPRTFLEVYDEIDLSDDDRTRWLADRRGAILGRSLAAKLHKKVGDRMSLTGTIYPGTWEFTVAGIYTATRKSIDQSTFFFHWDYLDQSLDEDRRGEIGWVVSRIDDVGHSADISRAVDRTFDDKDTQTITMSERALNLSFMAMFSAILTIVDIVSVIILLILVMILGNTVAMGVRERTNEYGVLRALGFSPGHIRFFILGEGVTLGILAGLAGLGFAYPLVNVGMSRFIEENMGGMFPYFRIEPITAGIAMILAVALGAAAAIIPAFRAGRIPVVEALRRID
jgi:putative ABC transport system permease protein